VALSFDSKWNSCHKRRHCRRIAAGREVCMEGLSWNSEVLALAVIIPFRIVVGFK
jgi:hypothetical protein